jgi:hypothetical protein
VVSNQLSYSLETYLEDKNWLKDHRRGLHMTLVVVLLCDHQTSFFRLYIYIYIYIYIGLHILLLLLLF